MNRDDAGLIRPHHSKLVLMQRIADAGWIVLVHLALVALYEHRAWEDHDTVATGAGSPTWSVPSRTC